MANIGSFDRIARLVLGSVLLIALFVPQLAGLMEGLGAGRYLIGAAGLVLIGTALFRFCPAYVLLGVSTCPIQRK